MSGWSPSSLASPKSRTFDPGLGEHNVAGLQIAVDDALLVRLLQRAGDLPGVAERLFQGERALFQPGRDRLPFHQLHHQVVGPDVVKDTDIGVVQGRNRPGLALEAGVELLASDFDGDGAA